MKNLFQPIQILFLLLFVACNSDDNVVPTGQPQPGNTLELTISAADFVTEGAPDTRATDNGKETTFDDNDRVGIIILDASDNPIYDNIPYKYDSSNKKWVFDDGNGKGGCYYDPKAATYIVYYPYSRAADGVRSEEDLKTIFAPKFNQSDIKDYRASDLMVWNSKGHLSSSVTTLNAVLEHAFASISLSPIAKYTLEDEPGTKCSPTSLKISDVSLTIGDNVYVPYQATDGSLRCIVPASINPVIRCFYTFNGTTYGNTINIQGAVAANTRYKSAPEIISNPYTLADAKVGDFYCKKNKDEGYLIPGDVALTDNQKKDCLGIVFWVGDEALNDDHFLKQDYSHCSHGLVVALHDAALNSSITMNWSSQTEFVQNWVKGNDIYKNVVNVQEINKMCGYSNTLALMAYNETKGAGNRLRVLPCDAIQQYSKANPTPENSSGWYFPSVMELKYVCWGQGKGQGITGCNNLNSYINKVDGTRFVSDNYWSSTEHSGTRLSAWYVYFGYGDVYNNGKYGRAFRVRPLLAF